MPRVNFLLYNTSRREDAMNHSGCEVPDMLCQMRLSGNRSKEERYCLLFSLDESRVEGRFSPFPESVRATGEVYKRIPALLIFTKVGENLISELVRDFVHDAIVVSRC